MNGQSIQRPLRILFVTNHCEEGASSRFRVYQYIPFLERQGMECRVAPFTSGVLYKLIHERGHLAEKVVRASASTVRRVTQLAASRRYDLVFIHREAFPFGPPVFELSFSRLSPHLVFDFDDAIHVGHDNAKELPNPVLYRLKYRRHVHRVIAAADTVIAGNRILADYARKFNARVRVVPTVVDTDKFSYRAPELRKSPVVIGWIGSPSTSSYLALVEHVFRALKARYRERVRFVICGDPAYKRLVAEAAVRPFNLGTEIQELRTFDIGIMPLPDNEWTRGKCAFKAIQYMALGIPAVCSPVGVTADLVNDGENGFLCQSESDWLEKLSWLVDSPELRLKIATRARASIEAEYSLRVWAPRFASLLTEAVSERA